jgi:hypothetical protein
MKIVFTGIVIVWFIVAMLLFIGKVRAYRAYLKHLDDE